MRPLDTLTTGRLNPGADDQGFVPAVAVTVGVPEICINPEDAERTVTVPEIVTGPVAVTVICEDRVTVPLESAVSTPAEDVTGPRLAPATEDVGVTAGHAWMSPEDADSTVGTPEICTNPELTLTVGILKLGAEDHGFVAEVEVTDGVPLICTNPEDAEKTVTVPEIG